MAFRKGKGRVKRGGIRRHWKSINQLVGDRL